MYKQRLFLGLLSVLLSFTIGNACNANPIVSSVADSTIIVFPFPIGNPTPPKSPSIIPISASYESLITSVILTFNQNLGEIEVEVLNTFTGYYDSGYINTLFLSAIIPITGGPGHYIITFTLPSGQQYQGEFDV